MSYQVLARKWRPQTFAEVLGQRHITTTLQNAILRDRVGHAYLFVGSRGIGKTTSARIFAKALNCEATVMDADGRPEPCCVCGTCKEIAAGNCLDVIEIDGASHNGVEDIRELRETVQYTPTNGRKYKVYIIDEVHMLSTAAWNALLKTLEEPPPHVKFLFATTEAHKVLPTILSRCQRFDLKRIEGSVIVARLRDIATRENLFITDAALLVIARAAEGGMRDAQSITDQMIAFCGGMDEASEISEADVIDVFGLASSDELSVAVGALLGNDPSGLMQAVHHLADRGRNLERLYADLLQYLRDLMIFQLAREPEKILDVTEAEHVALARLSKAAPTAVVQRLVEGLLTHDSGIRHTLNKRVYIESTLVRVMREAHALRMDDLVQRLRELRDGGGLTDLDGLAGVSGTGLASSGTGAAGAARLVEAVPMAEAKAEVVENVKVVKTEAAPVEALAAVAPAPAPAATPEPVAVPAPVAPVASAAPTAQEPAAPSLSAVLGAEEDAPATEKAVQATANASATPDDGIQATEAEPAGRFHDPLPGDAGMTTRLASDENLHRATTAIDDRESPSSAAEPEAPAPTVHTSAPAAPPTPAAAPVAPSASVTAPPAPVQAAGRAQPTIHATVEDDEIDDAEDLSDSYADDRPDEVRFSQASWRDLADGGGDQEAANERPTLGGTATDARESGMAVWRRVEANPFIQQMKDFFGGQIIDVRGRPREGTA